MGGGDLNLKKSWHPLTRRNLEIVWTLEQEQAKEKQKLDQLKKEKELEREKEHLRRLHETSGGKEEKPQRLEWMYSGGLHQMQTADSSGATQHLTVEESKAASGAERGAHFKTGSRVDLETKLREDPIFVVKRMEQQKNISLNSKKRLSSIAHPGSDDAYDLNFAIALSKSEASCGTATHAAQLFTYDQAMEFIARCFSGISMNWESVDSTARTCSPKPMLWCYATGQFSNKEV